MKNMDKKTEKKKTLTLGQYMSSQKIMSQKKGVEERLNDIPHLLRTYWPSPAE
jgi:hypothetical protein